MSPMAGVYSGTPGESDGVRSVALVGRKVMCGTFFFWACGCGVWAPSDCAEKASCPVVDEVDCGAASSTSASGEAGPAGLASAGRVLQDAPVDSLSTYADADITDAPTREDGLDAAFVDDAPDAPWEADVAPTDAADAALLDTGFGDVSDASMLGSCLLALYQFDETSGSTAHDSSGNKLDATLLGGATFAPGLLNNAVHLDGSGQFVSLPTNITAGLTSFSVSAWIFLNAASDFIRIFDFGSGTTAYMFLSPHILGTRFAITIGGLTGEQQTSAAASALPTGAWQHIAVTESGSRAILYVNGVQVAQNDATTVTPADLGTTTQNWLGRSQYTADPFFRACSTTFACTASALSASEVQELFQRSRNDVKSAQSVFNRNLAQDPVADRGVARGK